jgi:lipooligosaccharide transport system ATP-binding protein
MPPPAAVQLALPGAAPAPVVSLAGVSKRYRHVLAVDGVSLEVPPGLCFGLLGPNGAGKTTTLRMTYGVTQPTRGSVRVFGLDVARHTRAVRARLGVTLQENALIEALSPVENLRTFGRYYLLEGAALERRIDELLDFLELRSHARVPVRALSGGFQRRLAVAMSLMNRPELLILDEPTTGLDPAVRLSLWARVRALREQGTTVLLTTHYMDEAERLCDRLAIMAAGRVVEEGAPAELIRRTLAPEALELEAPDDEAAALLAELGQPLHLRMGMRLTLYAEDGAELALRIRARDARLGQPGHRFVMVRRTNLEDVFLRVTGTRLEAGA